MVGVIEAQANDGQVDVDEQSKRSFGIITHINIKALLMS